MMMRLTLFVFAALMGLSQAMAQGTDITFGGITTDTSRPVEVVSDSLTVDQTTQRGVFSGNVVVTQGPMTLTAGEIEVEYTEAGDGIERFLARGGVTLTSGPDAVKSVEAVYTIDSGDVVMTGDVLMTQGKAAISGQKLVMNLTTGRGRMEGRVTTTFVPEKN
jgi:lipopolysaccharide export system protein LptA